MAHMIIIGEPLDPVARPLALTCSKLCHVTIIENGRGKTCEASSSAQENLERYKHSVSKEHCAYMNERDHRPVLSPSGKSREFYLHDDVTFPAKWLTLDQKHPWFKNTPAAHHVER